MGSPEPDLELSTCVLCGRPLPADPVVRELGDVHFALHEACAEAGLDGTGLATPLEPGGFPEPRKDPVVPEPAAPPHRALAPPPEPPRPRAPGPSRSTRLDEFV